MASFDIVDLDRLEPSERDQHWQESLRAARLAAEYAKLDAANAEIGRKLTLRSTRPWTAARDVALIAADQGLAASQNAIDKELGNIWESARLGSLSRNGQIEIVIALHGMRPRRLTQQFILDQAYLAEILERDLDNQVERVNGWQQLAALMLRTAWLTEWAKETYIQIAERRRKNSSAAAFKSSEAYRPHQNEAHGVPLKGSYPADLVEAALKIRYETYPAHEPRPGADKDQVFVTRHINREIDRDSFREHRKQLGYAQDGRGRPKKPTK